MSRNYEALRKSGCDGTIVTTRHRVGPNPYRASARVQDASIISYARVLWGRKWTAAGFAALVVAAVAVITFSLTPQYEGVAQVGIYRQNQGLLNVAQVAAAAASNDDQDYSVTLDTQSQIIQGDDLAWQVIEKLDLEHKTAFAGKDNSISRSDALQNFQNSLKVVQVPHTRLLEIHYFSPDPQLAAEVANALAKAYIEHTFQVRYKSTMQASSRLSKRLRNLQDATDRSEAKLVEYQREHRITGSEALIGAKMAEINKNLTEAQVDRTSKQVEYDLAQASGADQVGRVEPNSLLDRLRSRESELSTEYAKVTSVMGPAHPQVAQLKNELDDVRNSITKELHRLERRVTNEYIAIVKREKYLRNSLETTKQEAAENNELAIEYGNLKREAETNRQLYTGLLQKLKEAEVAAQMGTDNIRIEALASVPPKPSKPNVLFNLALALFAGTLGGVLLAFVRENLDSSVRGPQQAERICGAPALAVIPKVAELSANNDGSSSRTASALVKDVAALESYRALRSLVLLHFWNSVHKVMLVTSSLPTEGKTTTASNAAMAFARKGRRVVLVDADLRKPSVHTAFGLSSIERGLTTVLNGADTLEDALIASPDNEDLFIIAAGPAVSDPTELLGGDRMLGLITKLRQQFDYVIIDSSPVLLRTDTLLLAPVVDAVLIVVREWSTPKDALARTRDLLARANARELGVVINHVTSSDMANYYYGYSGKAHETSAVA